MGKGFANHKLTLGPGKGSGIETTISKKKGNPEKSAFY